MTQHDSITVAVAQFWHAQEMIVKTETEWQHWTSVRRDALYSLREEQLSYQAIGNLVGLSKSRIGQILAD